MKNFRAFFFYNLKMLYVGAMAHLVIPALWKGEAGKSQVHTGLGYTMSSKPT